MEFLPERMLKYVTVELWRNVCSLRGCFRFLLTLRGSASRQSERCCEGDLPTLGRSDKDSLRDAARRRVFLRYGVAVGTVDDARSDRVHAKVARHQGVGPRRVSTRTPALVAQLESSRTVARERLRMEIRREVSLPITFMDCVDVLLEELTRRYCVGGNGSRRR